MAEKNVDLNWREKYHDLEGSLHKFRKEAGRVKDLLGVEVGLFNLRLVCMKLVYRVADQVRHKPTTS